MRVTVYGKPKCGLCESAKDKLKRMGVRFRSDSIERATTFHEGWRDDDSVAVTACYADIDTLPVVVLDGDAYSYPKAMKLLKQYVREWTAKETPIEQMAVA